MTKFTIIHEDHEIRAPMMANLIADFPVLLNSSLTPPKIYISAQRSITPRLIYQTNERRVSATLMIMQGILSNEMFPVRILFHPIQLLHSKIDFSAAKVSREKRIVRRSIIRIRE